MSSDTSSIEASAEYGAGRAAARCGTEAGNPHVPGTQAWARWLLGFRAAHYEANPPEESYSDAIRTAEGWKPYG